MLVRCDNSHSHRSGHPFPPKKAARLYQAQALKLRHFLLNLQGHSGFDAMPGFFQGPVDRRIQNR